MVELGVYQHYKGARYTILFNNVLSARDGTTRKAVYVSFETGKIFERPVSEFDDVVVWPDGSMAHRFVRIVEEG